MRYYNYIYFDKNLAPYYVGKGIGNRWQDRHGDRIPLPFQVLIFAQDLPEYACAFEGYLIQKIGRRDLGTGPLMNLNDGGGGGQRNPCKSTREGMSKGGLGNIESGQLASIQTFENRSKGGGISGRHNVESGHLASIRTFENRSKGGQISGRGNVESGHLKRIAVLGGKVQGPKNIKIARQRLTKEVLAAGGRTAGRIARDSGQLARITTYEVRAAGGRAVIDKLIQKNIESGHYARILTPERQAKALHFRWHVKRNIIKDGCAFCAAVPKAACA